MDYPFISSYFLLIYFHAEPFGSDFFSRETTDAREYRRGAHPTSCFSQFIHSLLAALSDTQGSRLAVLQMVLS